MEIAPSKTAIEVGALEALPEVIATLRQAAEAGELDEQLKVSPFVRPMKTKPTKV